MTRWTQERKDEELERLVADPPDGLVEWAEDQDVDLRKWRSINWGNLAKKINRWRMMDAAKCYVGEQVRLLVGKYRVTASRKIARGIVHGVLEDRLLRSAEVCRLWGNRSEDGDSELLPGFLRWVFNHPGLALDAETLGDPVARSFIEAYERDNPPPNQGAVNLYYAAKQDGKAFAKLFADVHAAVQAERKKIKEVAREEDPLVADAESFDRQYAEMLGEIVPERVE